MDTPRDSSSRVRAVLRTPTPLASLWGFLLLLAVVFVGSYALGAAVGPIGPGTRPPSTSGTGGESAPEDTHDTRHTHSGDHR